MTDMTEEYCGYAKSYNCTIAEAIRDRDWPLNHGECIAEFLAATGRHPTADEIETMGPDGEQSINDYRDSQAFDLSY